MTPNSFANRCSATWTHSREWGYYPSGGSGLVMIIVIALLFLGRI